MTAIEGYAARGFDLLFWSRGVDPGDDWKAPRDKGWSTRSYQPSDYRDGMQVGVKTGTEIAPGRFLVDVDFDWAPGIAFAHKFLPPTGFEFGRASKPGGHRFYTMSEPVKHESFEDVDGSTLVELRGTKADGTIGKQTMLPPSIHRTSGECVTMRRDGEIAHVDAVPEGVTYYAVACLLGRHWPKNGPATNQHDCAAYVAGFLCRRGVDPRLVPTIVEVAATLGGDENVSDRVHYARDTVAKFEVGETRLAGGPKLAAEIGDKVVARLKKWLPSADSLAAAIERLNEKFAIVSVGNKVVVMETRADGGIKALWPFEEFKRLLVKEDVEIPNGEDTKRVPVADRWLKHRDGRRYERLVYAMPGGVEVCEPGDFNGYLSFTVVPVAGDWSRNREHLLRIICRGRADLYAWVFNWMAALVQWPGRHAFTAIVLRGGQGTGKGHFAHLMLGALFHSQQYLHVVGGGMLTGRFNEHLSGKVLVFADESTWGGDPAAADKLKGMVTEGTIPIERKFLPLVEEPSALHIVIASNNEWPISIAMDDRRFIVLDVADSERQNDAHFAPLRHELNNGGLAAMLSDLLAHPIDEHALRHPPSTAGKREVMAQSLKPVERWWFEKLTRGSLDLAPKKDDRPAPDIVGDWPPMVPKAELHADYLQFLDIHRETRARRSTETELGQFLKKYTPMRSNRRLPGVGSTRVYVWDLPTLDECRAFWARECGWPAEFDWEQE